MNKMDASILINNVLQKKELNPNNKGNVKFSNINLKKPVYWLNILIDERLNNFYHLILNDNISKILYHFVIPPNALCKEDFKIKYSNEKPQLDIEISTINDNFTDVKSGGSKFNFNKFFNLKYPY